MIAAIVIACAAFALASLAYIEAIGTRDRLNGFIEDVEREFNDL